MGINAMKAQLFYVCPACASDAISQRNGLGICRTCGFQADEEQFMVQSFTPMTERVDIPDWRLAQ